MNYLKSLWHTEFFTISINKKTLIGLVVIYGLFKLYHYGWEQGAKEAFSYMMQNPQNQQQQSDAVPDDQGQPGTFH